MATPRATWTGYLKLSLVSCPVRLFAATSEASRVSFHLLHKDTHNRVQMQPRDPELGDVDRSELVKGYEYEKDRYVILTDEDFAKVKVESDDTINIESFVDGAEVDPLYLDAPYYLSPEGGVGEEAFRVIHEAMRRKNKVALSRVALSGRERRVAVQARGRGMLVTTLRSAQEVRNAELYFEEIKDGPLAPEMIDLAAQLIEQRAAHFDPKGFVDRHQEALLALVKDKLAGAEPVVAKAPERGKVINLMDALRESLSRAEPEKAKAEAPASPKRRAQGGDRDGAPRRRNAGGTR